MRVGDDAEPRARVRLRSCWRRGSRRRSVTSSLAREHIGLATEIADETNDTDLQARCAYYLAYVVSHHGDFRQAIELTDRSRALYLALERPWDLAANELFAARAAISAGDQQLAAEACDRVQERARCRRRPVAARPRRCAARRARAAAGPLRRRRLALRACVGDLATARLPSDRGVSGRESRAGPVPGRRLRRGRRHPAARRRQGRGDWRPPHGGARSHTSRASAPGTRGSGSTPAPHSNRQSHGIARRAAASRRCSPSASWRRWMLPTASRARKSDSLSRSMSPEPTTKRMSRSSRSTPSGASPLKRVMPPVPTPSCGGGSPNGGGRPFHLRARPRGSTKPRARTLQQRYFADDAIRPLGRRAVRESGRT